MKINYVPFCYKYKKNRSAPVWLRNSGYILIPYVFAMSAAQAHGFRYLATGAGFGSLLAIAGVYPAHVILRALKVHPVRGSGILQRLQFASVALGLCIGGGLEYRFHQVRASAENRSPVSSPMRPIEASGVVHINKLRHQV